MPAWPSYANYHEYELRPLSLSLSLSLSLQLYLHNIHSIVVSTRRYFPYYKTLHFLPERAGARDNIGNLVREAFPWWAYAAALSFLFSSILFHTPTQQRWKHGKLQGAVFIARLLFSVSKGSDSAMCHHLLATYRI